MIKIPEGTEVCFQCDGEGYLGFEDGTGNPYACYLCGETGLLPAGYEAEMNRRERERQQDRHQEWLSDVEVEQRGYEEEARCYFMALPLHEKVMHIATEWYYRARRVISRAIDKARRVDSEIPF